MYYLLYQKYECSEKYWERFESLHHMSDWIVTKYMSYYRHRQCMGECNGEDTSLNQPNKEELNAFINNFHALQYFDTANQNVNNNFDVIMKCIEL